MLSTAAVGIDITDQQVSIVCLKKHLKAVRLVAAEKCLLDADKQLKDKTADISGFINEFLKDNRISAADIFIGIPSERMIFREIELPLAVKENLAATLAYEMEKYVPLAAADVYYDFQVTGEDKEREMITVSLSVVKQADLEPCLNVAAALDLTASGISPGCAGVANSFMKTEKSNGICRMVAFADGDRLDLAVIRGRALIYAKTLPAGAGEGSEEKRIQQVKALLDRFGVPDAQVPVYLHTLDPEEDAARQLEAAGPTAYQGAKPPGQDLPASEYIPAYGLALQAFDNAAGHINLMPVNLRKKPNKTPLYVMYGLAGCLLLAGLLWAGVFVAKQRALLNHLDQNLAELRVEAREIEQLRTDIDQLQARIHRLESLRPGNAYMLNVMMELTQRIPENAWVRDLKISGNEVNIFGSAESASELVPALDESSLFHGVEFVSTIRKTKNNQELYRIGLQFHREK